jgi:ADP-ribose pyrophosphatase YjhB (NUDIX family)
MSVPVTDQLLHQLVVGSHAEGTSCLAVAAAIEHDDRVLLVAELGDDFETVWQLPADLVLPGETLTQALDRTVTTTTGLGIIDITAYAGHHDRLVDGDVIRTFVFAVTSDDPDRVCRWANIGHHWSSDPITACSILGDLERHPLCTATPAGSVIGPTPIERLSAALRANVKGLLCQEAAVELLIKQQTWLHRRDFVDGFIDADTTYHSTAQPGGAFVDWAAALTALDAGDLPCSSGEGQLLRIASSLAEGIPVDLRDAITGMDSTNTGLVARAVCHAAGHRQ